MTQQDVRVDHEPVAQPDTPATGYRLLPTRTTAVIVASLVVLAALAWWLTARTADSMGGMVHGLGEVGRKMPNDMGPLDFLSMWAIMMTAMMAVAAAPVALAHRSLQARRNKGSASTAAFVVGFLVVWSLVGVAYFLPFLWFRDLTADTSESRWFTVLAGAILVLAGAYQFTRRKTHCQQACCAPQSLVSGQDSGGGVSGGLRNGISHGVHCLGCCWALMTVLLVVGLMNLIWMAALTALFVLEKHSPRALRLGQVAGVALVLLGLAVMARPSVLYTISGTPADPVPVEMMEGMEGMDMDKDAPMPGMDMDPNAPMPGMDMDPNTTMPGMNMDPNMPGMNMDPNMPGMNMDPNTTMPGMNMDPNMPGMNSSVPPPPGT